MKKVLLALLALMLVLTFTFGLASCETEKTVEFDLTFVVDGEVYATVGTSGGETIKIPANPTREGYTFDGWYLDEGTWEKPFTADSLLDTELSGDMRIYPKWVENTPACEHTDTDNNSLCDKCGESYTDGNNTPEHTHEYNQQNTDSKYLATAADCENAATYYYSCSCGATGTTAFASGNALGHRDADDNSLCDKCGTSYTDGNDTPEHTHEYNQQSTDSKYLATAADCENAATYYYSCSCGATGTIAFASGNALGHSYTLEKAESQYEKAPATESSPAVYWKSCSCGKASTTETFTYGDALPSYLTYELSSDGTYYIVTGVSSNVENIIIPDTYKSLPVLSIGDSAFKNCTSLKNVTIGNNVKYMGNYAFYNCIALEEIYFNATAMDHLLLENHVFYNAGKNGNGINVVIGKNVTKIPAYLFNPYYSSSYSPKITSVEFEEGSVCESIGNYAFCNCDSLTSVYITDIAAWCNISFGDIYANPLCYANNLYLNGILVTELEIPNTVKAINAYAFYSYDSLTSVTFENNSQLTSIGDDAFSNCTSLTSVTIPDSVVSIGWSAFWDCTSLTSVTIGTSIESIEKYAFSHCTALEEICFNATAMNDLSSSNYVFSKAGRNGNGIRVVIGKSVTKIPTYLFSPEGRDSSYSPKITSVEFEENSICQSIGNYAFWDCTSLTSVTFENNSQLTSIGNGAFRDCTSLTSVTIPDSVTSIGRSAFLYCTSLTSVTIGNNVTSIGNDAFSGCTALEQINFNATAMNDLMEDNCLFENAGENGNGIKVVIGKNVTKIPSYIFYTSPKIISVEFEEGSVCKSIGNDVLRGCTTLASVTIPNSVTSIGNYAFYGCIRLVEVINHSSLDIKIGSDSSSFGYVAKYAKVVHSGESKIANQNGYIFMALEDANYLIEYTGVDTELTLPESYNGNNYEIYEYTFYNYTNLTSVIVPKSVTRIARGAFYGCSYLQSITLPFIGGSAKTSSDLEQYPFGYIFGSLSYRNGVATEQKYYGPDKYYPITSTYYIPSMLTSVTITGENILYGAFYNCTNLKNVTIQNSVTRIGNCAFEGCTSLATVTIPNSITSISESMFSDCTGLTSITIPNSVTRIEGCAFYGCASLTSITIPNSVTSIGYNAFYNCYKLVDVINLSSLEITMRTKDHGYVAYYALNVTKTESGRKVWTDNNGYIFYDGGSACYLLGYAGSVKDLTLPENCNGKNYKIYKYAFYSCYNVNSVTIPNSVTSIDDYAFLNCKSLKSVTFENNSQLTSIGSAFGNCTSLTSVHITDIESWCKISFKYAYCNPLYYAKNLYINGESITNLVIPDGVTIIYAYAFYNCINLTSVSIPDSVINISCDAFTGCKNLIKTYNSGYYLGNASNPYIIFVKPEDTSITSFDIHANTKIISSEAFYGCTNLTNVTIPNSVTSIGSYAFGGCTSLTSVTIPNSVTSIRASAFEDCDSLTSVTIPNSVTSIGSYAFAYCASLTSVTIPKSVTSIGSYAFYNCTNLTSVYITDITAWCKIDFYNSYSNPLYYAKNLYLKSALVTNLVIPNSVISIGDYAFYNCTSFTSVTIPDSITSIGNDVFYGCTNIAYNTYGNGCYLGNTSNPYVVFVKPNDTSITSFDIHEKTKIISNDAFMDCSNLENVAIPNSVTSIGDYAFRGCSSLRSVTIGNGVTSIGSPAFYNCTNLTSVYITDIAAWCKIDFYNSYSNPLYYAKNLYLNGELVTDLVIPNGVESISDYAFYNCTSLTSVTIPNSVTSISDYAFYNCTSLTSLTIPNSVTSIGNYAFRSCTSLTSIKYRGTEEQWNAITKGSYWDYITGDYTITYNYDGE